MGSYQHQVEFKVSFIQNPWRKMKLKKNFIFWRQNFYYWIKKWLLESQSSYKTFFPASESKKEYNSMNVRLENRVLNFFHEYLYTVTKVTIRNSTSKTKLKNPLCTSILQGMLGNISIFFAPKLFNAFWEFCGKLFFAYIIIRVLPENSQTFPVINK